MRKSILIFGVLLTSFSLMALGYMKWSGPVTSDTRASSSGIAALDNFLPGTLFRSANKNFLYNVDSRYMSNITKEELDKARSIIDIVPKGCNVKLVSYSGVQVSILGDDTETSEMGENELLNRAQIKLLRSTDYSADFYVNANCKKRDSETGELTDHRLVYYISVIPENEAVYASGHDALINYLKENSRKEIRIAERDQLKPGKVSFIVTAK